MDVISKQWDQFLEQLKDTELWMQIGERSVRILFIILIAFIVSKIGKTLIIRIFNQQKRGPFQITQRREATLTKLLVNALTYTVYFAAIIMILETMDFQVGALLAGAGVAGLAIGFGAQNLVRDIITGFFIIFEDQFSVGDFIRVSNKEGIVEEIGLRTTKIKSWTGELHIIPNGNITEVTNFSIHNSVAVVDISIAYEGDLNKSYQETEELLKELPERYPEFITPPELLGVQNLGASEVVLRVIAEVPPMEHWRMARIIRKEIKQRFDERNIEIPFPRLVLYHPKEKQEKDEKEHEQKEGGLGNG